MSAFAQRRALPPPAGKPRLTALLVACGVGLIGLGVATWSLLDPPPADVVTISSGRLTAGGGAGLVDRAGPSDRAPDRAAGAWLSAPDHWRNRWRAMSAEPAADARAAGLIALLEEWADDEPLRALTFARAESDPLLRGRFLSAVLRAWAKIDPEAAAAQARALPEADRANAVAAVLTGVAHEPETAVHLAGRLCRDDPTLAREHGCALIAALAQLGEYRTAVRFAVAAEGAGEGEDRLKWIQAAFSRWARQEPEYAALAALQLPDDGTRFEALLAVIPYWVQIDPSGAAEIVQELPEEVDRRNLMGETLRRWVTLDPVEAAGWLSRLDPQPMLDSGTAALASLPSLVAGRPEVAIGWAESIIDPHLRSRTLVEILQQWASADPAAARSYLVHSTMVLDEDRHGTDYGG